MKKALFILVLVACAVLVVAIPFTPQGDIELHGIYDILNIKNLNQSGNASFYGTFVNITGTLYAETLDGQEDLNVNSSDYWDNLDSLANITDLNLTTANITGTLYTGENVYVLGNPPLIGLNNTVGGNPAIGSQICWSEGPIGGYEFCLRYSGNDDTFKIFADGSGNTPFSIKRSTDLITLNGLTIDNAENIDSDGNISLQNDSRVSYSDTGTYQTFNGTCFNTYVENVLVMSVGCI
jgi:hypothetical protein